MRASGMHPLLCSIEGLRCKAIEIPPARAHDERIKKFGEIRRVTPFAWVRDPIIMRPIILPLLALAVSLSLARPASAQFGIPNFRGNHTPIGEEIQAQRKTQMSQQQQYSKPRPKSAAPGAAAPSYRRGPADAFGRVDLSGRAAPGYPTIRDNSYTFGASRYRKTRRSSVRTAPRLFPGVVGNPSRRAR
jgi:hypothetical protein